MSGGPGTSPGKEAPVAPALAALTALDKATIALVVVTGLLGLFALGQLLVVMRSEGRRVQPVAIAHEAGQHDLSSFDVFLTNEGSGTAFNVRFGVKFDRAEYPIGAGRGNRYLVAPGGRVPPADPATVRAPDTFRVSYPVSGLVAPGQAPGGFERRVFFARYENAYGKTWETLNPADPTAGFIIRRRRLARLHEWRQARRRRRNERIVNRRLAEELSSGGDLSALPLRRRIMRRFGR